MSAARSQPVVIFLHLPKTAGSTLAGIMERQYDANSMLSLYESRLGEELAAISQCEMQRLRAVMGHVYFGAHTFLSKPFSYITILRDPVDRVISHYYFVRRDPSHYLYDSARTLGLKEFVESCNQQEPNNDQTRLLAGNDDGAGFGTRAEEALAVAKHNLERYFAAVGLTEEFDRSLILMKRILGWRNPFYVSQNVSPHRPRKEELPLETLRVIQTHNKLDIELYRHARELFHEQVRQQGRGLDREIQSFQKLNVSYGRVVLFMESVIKRAAARRQSARSFAINE